MKNSLFASKNYILFLVVAFLALSPLSSQETEKKTGQEPNHKNQKIETQPMKYEEGDVLIDMKIESERLRKISDRKSSRLETSFINLQKNSEWKGIQDTFSQAKLASLRGEYQESRRLFHQGITDLDKQAEEFVGVYKNHFNEYTNELNNLLVKIKNDTDINQSNRNLYPYMAGRAKEAGIFYRQGEFLSSSRRPVMALRYFQLSTKELLEGIRRGREELEKSTDKNSEENRESNTDTQETQPKYLKVDYLSLEERKVWDDSRSLNHSEEEKARIKERKRIEEYISLRKEKSEKSQEAKKEDKIENESQPNSKPEDKNSQ